MSEKNIQETQSQEMINDFLEKIKNSDGIQSIRKLMEDLKVKIKNGSIDPLYLKTSAIFDKLIEIANNSQYALLTDSIDSLFEILGIKIEEIKQFILRIEAKEAITRFLNQYKDTSKQDLIYTRFLVDFWNYPIEIAGISTEKMEDLIIKIITKTKREPRKYAVPEEIKAREEEFISLVSENIMETKALQYFERIKHMFPIDLDNLIVKTSTIYISIDDSLKLYQYKQNRAKNRIEDTEQQTREEEISGIECFSYILLLIQLKKIKFDPETNILKLI